MKVAIMGCGPGGSYLYRLLKINKPDVEVALFDLPSKTRCGVKPCGWAVGLFEFTGLCEKALLTPSKYIMGRYNHTIIDGMKVRASIVVINKPQLIADLLDGNKPTLPPKVKGEIFKFYDRIVDATGRRTYLPRPSAMFRTKAIQVRCRSNNVSFPMAFTYPGDGYTWVIPLAGHQVHIGSGSIYHKQLQQRVDMIKQQLGIEATMCSCEANICGAGPTLPFIEGIVWGLGESIGLVDPIVGAGIIPAMNSARMMVENWDNLVAYKKAVLSRYSYMIKEAKILDKLKAGHKMGIVDMLTVVGAAYGSGIYPDITKSIRLYRRSRTNSRI